MCQFDGKVVIVTGAAGGIGRAAALSFAAKGALVTIADVNEIGLCETAALIREAKGKSLSLITDVSDENACNLMVQQTIKEFGQLDVIFNNAGIAGARGLTADQTAKEWQRVIDINLNGVFYCSKAAIPEMLKTGGGVIINTASVDGLVGMASLPHYTAAKHGVMGLTKCTALEYGGQNIRSLAIAPGYIKTDMAESAFTESEKALLSTMAPIGRGAEPQEIANFVIWAASDQASYVNGSFHTLDGGLIAGFGATGS